MDKLAQFCNGFSCASIELWMHLRDLMRIQEAYVQSNVASNKSEACSSFSFRQPRSRPPLTRWKRGNDVIVSNLRSETIACEASVSVLFRSKGRAKNGASKRGGVGKKVAFPSPSPSFIFCLSFHFSRGQNREYRSSVFLCSEKTLKRLLRRLVKP